MTTMTRSRRIIGAVATIGLLVAAVPALAHHSLQSEFDIEKSITLKGVVTRVDWVNPHVRVYLDVKARRAVRQPHPH